MVKEVRTGYSVIPHGVRLIINATHATIAMERAKLKATRSILPKALLLGKRAATNVYPGKKSKKGSPRITRKTLDWKKVMIIMSRITRILIKRSSFLDLIVTVKHQFPLIYVISYAWCIKPYNEYNTKIR